MNLSRDSFRLFEGDGFYDRMFFFARKAVITYAEEDVFGLFLDNEVCHVWMYVGVCFCSLAPLWTRMHSCRASWIWLIWTWILHSLFRKLFRWWRNDIQCRNKTCKIIGRAMMHFWRASREEESSWWPIHCNPRNLAFQKDTRVQSTFQRLE